MLAGFLTAVCEILDQLYGPCIKNSKKWGQLSSTLHGRHNRKDFMDKFDHFYKFFEECKKDIQCQATLKESAILDLSQMKNVHDCINLATNPQKLAIIEELVLIWSKQIELVLAESEQMRKEADDTGPLAELEHWRHLVAKFSSIMEQINGHDCKMVIHTLVAAKSKVLKVWKELDARITDAFNEARDNVKFLYTLETFCEPLYKGQLETMQEHVSSLINAIRMIHAVSRYYNTSERMTSLFVKVTNQMVTSCKRYITNDGLSCVWDQSPKKVIEKLKCCQRLYHDYQDNFKCVKKKIKETAGEESFKFSEMYVFGKYEAFCKRLDKIIELLNIIETYSVLSHSHIEGIQSIAAKFLHICSAIKNKVYDNLDPRKLDFDNDFEEFKQQVADLQGQLQQFLNRNFQDITSTIKALQLLQRFEKLCIPGLDIESKYIAILEHYGEELKHVSQLYNQQKDNPPYPRNMSPFAGRIAWVKHLFKKINEPMECLKVYLPTLNSKDVLGIVLTYNQVAQVLVHFELLYHMAWRKQVETIASRVNIARTRGFPGANIRSDHDLLMMTFPFHLKKISKPKYTRIMFDLEKLKDPDVAQVFQAMIGGKFAPLTILDDENRDLDVMITNFNITVTDTANKILGKHCRTKKPWVTPDISNLCEKRRELKKRKGNPEGMQKYREVNNKIKKGMMKAKENWVEEQCNEIEENLNNNNSKKAYQLVKYLRTIKQGRTTTIQYKTEKCIIEKQEILHQWTEYCSKLYNHKTSGDPMVLHCPQTTEEELYPILQEQLENAVRSLKKVKSAGVDNISAGLVQARGKALITTHTKICNKIWQTGEWPTHWTQCLQVTVLVAHPETRDLYVNFDPLILQTIHEAQQLLKMDLDIPDTVMLLCLAEKKLKSAYCQAKALLDNFVSLKKKIPQVFLPLMSPLLKKVNAVFGPGLTYITWTSLKLPEYFVTVSNSLKHLEHVINQVADIKTSRIDNILDEISNSELIEFPTTKPWTAVEFIENTRALKCNMFSEGEMITELFDDNLSDLPIEGEDSDVDVFVDHSDSDFSYSDVVRPTKIHKMLSTDSESESDDDSTDVPVIYPSLDDIQQAINKSVQLIMNVSQNVINWEKPLVGIKTSGRENGSKKVVSTSHEETNYYKIISDNKDISKIVMMLNSAITSIRKEVKDIITTYDEYETLWKGNKEEKIKEFMAQDPPLAEIKVLMLYYEDIEITICDIPPSVSTGVVEVFTEDIKLSLSVEARGWKMLLGKYLNMTYHHKVMDIVEFISESSKKLSRPINDLDDVRSAMACLEEIRESEIKIDMMLNPIEEAYSMLVKFQLPFSKEETEQVDTLRYSFLKLLSQSTLVQNKLNEIQPKFRKELIEKVEVFKQSVKTYEEEYEKTGPMEYGIPPQEASERLAVFKTQFDDLWRKFETYSGGQNLFAIPVTTYPSLNRIKKELNLLQKLYGLYNQVMDSINGYFDILWVEVDIEKINEELQDFQNRCRKLPKGMKDWQAFIDLKQKIDDFNETCPLLELMSNKTMKDRHWDRIATITGYKFDRESETFSLRNVMEAPLLKYRDDVEEICISAVKEKEIEAKLKQVILDWNTKEFSFASFKNRGDLLLKAVDVAETVSFLEDSLMILGSLLSNRYNAPFKTEIQSWVQKLSNASDIIENWLVVQNLWVYLEAVFIGGDIAKQLPKEAKRFQNIDKSWVKVMTKAHETTNVIECCTGDEMVGQLLPHLLEQLEICQKSLVGYLESKRLVFPRFFFVSDPTLLEILGQASDSHTIQAHLLGVFENVAKVLFHEKDYDRILSVYSREEEEIMLEKSIIAKGNVEIWLGELLEIQQKSLHGIIRDCYQALDDSDFKLISFLKKYIAQVSLLGLQMLWTKNAEDALNYARQDKKIMNFMNNKFIEILRKLIEQTTYDMTKYERVKFETLITIHVHQRDIFEDLVKMHIRTPSDFEWLKQARFYFNMDTDQCIVQITNVSFIYQNEFLGCTDRLVITPLTDRCYITLAQALGMNMGGAPAGPAGTGKTETTKDMGKALGKYVVVFNCSDQMDFRGLGRIYKGLAQSGSWGCFDEFNRIELPVLSVAAQQIHIVLSARKERKKQFIFSDGDEVNLNPEFGLFITMNPGYAGRQELPENLKVQFRSVAMMVPDRQIIMRVKLASCGFQENAILAQKFYTLYKLCEEQLTRQVHYDFGLRNILSVLRTLGAEKRSRPHESEWMIVMRVLRDMNISKLVDEDEPLFLSLISDLFPGIELDSATYPELQTAIANQVEATGLINHPSWNLKVVQLYETQRVRHGIMTLGPSGAGKSCCIHILMKAMTDCGEIHKEMRMNPKAITASQMFGHLDVATNDWTDGIFSAMWRKTLKSKKGEHIWLVLDGPVDAVWIENLNSVLDDNKTLTLANGDRIPMTPHCKIIFETHNIDNASPATVSRNGMVYMSSSGLPWKPILKSWLKKRPKQEAEILEGLFDMVFSDVYQYIATTLTPKMELLECNYIKQAMDLLEGMLPTDETGGVSLSGLQVEKNFVFALMWSFGALLEPPDRELMAQFLKNHPYKLKLPPAEETEKGNTIFEFCVNQKGEWEHWDHQVEEYLYPTDHVPAFSSILVPNVDNIQTDFLIQTISKQGKAVLLIGEQGTAKTVIIKSFLSKYNPEEHTFKNVSFSSATTPVMFQRTVESYIDKRMGNTYGPPAGRKMTIFIDDINMPIINEWGDQVTNELVRQLKEMNGFYSLDKPGDVTNIIDIQFIAAMIHPGGGRNDIPSRLKRQFSVFNCTLPSNNSIDKIFCVIGCGYFCSTRFCEEIVNFLPKLVTTTRILWHETKKKMLPTPAKFHYIFNLRDLSRIWEGMLKIRGEECKLMRDILSLWKHEVTRVIADRFTNEEDKVWFLSTLHNVVSSHLGENLSSELPAEPYFVNFLKDPPEPTGEEADDIAIEVPKVYEEGAALNENNYLYEGRSYGIGNLLDDLKYLYRVAGGEGKGITFIFTDNDIKDEAFLEYLNNILSSGEVANLFARDELEEICQNLVQPMKKELPKWAPTQENLYDYFLSRARNNLHVVLCFSPVGDKFRNRALKFPGLISGCTMDWFSRWPKDALVAVAQNFLSEFEMACSLEVKNNVVEAMGELHDGVVHICGEYFGRFRRQTYVTPKSYLSFINGYKTIYREKRQLINELAERINTGLEKLLEATASVAILKDELAIKEKELEVASVKASKVLQKVTMSAQAAEKVKNEVQKVKDKAQGIVDEISADKLVAEEKLEAAKPALEEAENALKTIKAADISTVRKLGKPPHLIMRVMDCVLLLFQKKLDINAPDPEKPCPKPSWVESLKVMSNTQFLSQLQNFPKDTINEETVEFMTPYLEMEDYNIETVKKVCGNVAGLLSWTQAMAFFYGINKQVLPLKANLAVQEAQLEVANSELASAQAVLDEKQKELDKAQALYDTAVQEKQDLIDDAKRCKRKMIAAETLINGLSGEKERWTEQSKEFTAQIERTTGDALLCTGFLSYCGPFNQEFRNLLLKNWQQEMDKRGVPYSTDLNLTSSLADAPTIGEWNLQGLPNDDLSIQNGIIVTKASRYPLLIDPQGQGKSWINNKEKHYGLLITSLHHKYFRSHLEDALSMGKPLLIKDVEEVLDPVLDNILEKNYVKSGTSYKVKLGDKECDVMENFRLYITTKLANPCFSPEVSARTSVIDFTVTIKGLEDQLLGRVIMSEKQELEADRKKLMESVTANKRKMKELEDNLLYKLTSTKGSLVDDESLIHVLTNTKETAAEVSEKLNIAAETEIMINNAREEFRPVAARGSILYFLICDISMVNVMYQTSLVQFLELFDMAIRNSEKSPVAAKRITNINEYLTYEVFKYTCRGLYENHKFLFTLLLTLKIDMQQGKISHEEFQILIKGGAALDLKTVPPKPAKWITDISWLNLVELSKLHQFQEILAKVKKNEKSWKSWYENDAPEEEEIPSGYQMSLDSFHRLLFIRCWCQDRMLFQARKYISDVMGAKYADPVILNLEHTWKESNTRTPLICLLSMGSDPTGQIETLSKKKGIDCRAISMGQGQEVHARRLMGQCMTGGGWMLLQNCHLGLDFLEEFMDTLLTTGTIHDSFCVWITTEVHPKFPISLLQMSIKFTNDPPQGVQAGLKQMYSTITQDQLDLINYPQWQPLLYAVSFLHSVVQERRKFGPLGWNIPYEFNSADWVASVQFVQNHLDDMDPKKGVSWNTVRYMIGEVQYGGRVTDDYDKRLLNTFAKAWFGDHMFLEDFSFYTGYKIPKCSSINQYINFIQELPSVDSPQAFGLHSNADITYQNSTATDILNTILSIQPKDASSGGGATRESTVQRLSDDMLERLPPDYVPHEVYARLQKMGVLSSMNIFLRQEIDRMQLVIAAVRSTLTNLKLAIEGTIIMNENLRDVLDSIYDTKVPEIWKHISWESTTIGFWFTELLERNTQFSSWIFEKRPDVFWMTGFFNPQGFLTAMRQEVTRAHRGWALDSVTLHNEVLRHFKEEISSPPQEGVYVHGLFLDGAGWDRKNCKITESLPKMLFTSLPVVHIYAITSTAPKDQCLYQCPVYKKPKRTDLTYINSLWLKTSQNPDHWTLRGVALLCDIK
ncbi:dynein heavy chain 8, axonemal-like [Limulus polyphemus]|uniref:Dynein heavy chain 8, axonemal-like n=1 Tax=Limulus polyphemus TaxID=6850 RepID=A0ABM1S651_LIMPO|nr:dynein heavy chain 8, axonemal-like [Limulus polyphemus]